MAHNVLTRFMIKSVINKILSVSSAIEMESGSRIDNLNEEDT